MENKLNQDCKLSSPKSTQYQYGYVELEIVMSNPDEFIIPACQPACISLWNKNIETFMVSNDDDDYLYILFYKLDRTNQAIIENAIKVDSRFFYSNDRKAFGIRVNGNIEDIEKAKELEALTDIFTMQDTFRYKNRDKFLEEYKRTGSITYEVQPDGTILIKENSLLSGVTFEEAIEKSGKSDLYIEEEGKIYDSPTYLMWHQRYINFIKDNCISPKTR